MATRTQISGRMNELQHGRWKGDKEVTHTIWFPVIELPPLLPRPPPQMGSPRQGPQPAAASRPTRPWTPCTPTHRARKHSASLSISASMLRLSSPLTSRVSSSTAEEAEEAEGGEGKATKDGQKQITSSRMSWSHRLLLSPSEVSTRILSASMGTVNTCVFCRRIKDSGPSCTSILNYMVEEFLLTCKNTIERVTHILPHLLCPPYDLILSDQHRHAVAQVRDLEHCTPSVGCWCMHGIGGSVSPSE